MGIKYIVMYNILFYDLLKGKQKCSKPRISPVVEMGGGDFTMSISYGSSPL
jgi:hypothetical protein